MITVISSTNRLGSNTYKIAKVYCEILGNQGADHQLMDLCQLPRDIAFSELYGSRSTFFQQEFTSIVEKSEKFVFVIPEYNGGFPGILKLFIDALPPKVWHDKKAGLVGLASGLNGALRPMDQFSNVLNYLKVDVISDKPKLSKIDDALDEQGNVINETYFRLLELHAEKMIGF